MTTERTLVIGADGCPVFTDGENLERFDLNAYYKGYFPSCRWTAAGSGELYYLAGTDEKGSPHLFSSASGSVWTEVSILSKISAVPASAYGDIVSVLCDREGRQVFLVTENGWLVTLPDGPQCVRARHLFDARPVGAAVIGEEIAVTDETGAVTHIPVKDVQQYRCSITFAKPFLRRSGILVDLRHRDMWEDLLAKADTRTPVFFFCEHGHRADEAARQAREDGYLQAYSLGGAYALQEEMALYL